MFKLVITLVKQLNVIFSSIIIFILHFKQDNNAKWNSWVIINFFPFSRYTWREEIFICLVCDTQMRCLLVHTIFEQQNVQIRWRNIYPCFFYGGYGPFLFFVFQPSAYLGIGWGRLKENMIRLVLGKWKWGRRQEVAL